jgi:hypothetical protein
MYDLSRPGMSFEVTSIPGALSQHDSLTSFAYRSRTDTTFLIKSCLVDRRSSRVAL